MCFRNGLMLQHHLLTGVLRFWWSFAEKLGILYERCQCHKTNCDRWLLGRDSFANDKSTLTSRCSVLLRVADEPHSSVIDSRFIAKNTSDSFTFPSLAIFFIHDRCRFPTFDDRHSPQRSAQVIAGSLENFLVCADKKVKRRLGCVRTEMSVWWWWLVSLLRSRLA